MKPANAIRLSLLSLCVVMCGIAQDARTMILAALESICSTQYLVLSTWYSVLGSYTFANVAHSWVLYS